MSKLVWENPPEWIWFPGVDRRINMTQYAQDPQYKEEVDALLEAGIQFAQDQARPCKGTNINVCVGEGCFSNACIRDKFKKGDT